MTIGQYAVGAITFSLLSAAAAPFIAATLFGVTAPLPPYVGLMTAYLLWVCHARNVQNEAVQERVLSRQVDQQLEKWGIG